jgi:hypothetical protein
MEVGTCQNREKSILTYQKGRYTRRWCKQIDLYCLSPAFTYGMPKCLSPAFTVRYAQDSQERNTNSKMHRFSYINLAKYFAVLLRPFVGQSEHHLRNSETFVQRKPYGTDILVRFDVVSVFIKIPLENTTTNTFTEISQADCRVHETCPNNHIFSSCRLVLPTEGRSVHRIPLVPVAANCRSCGTLWTESHKHSCK